MTSARVVVESRAVGEIAQGLLVLVGVEAADAEPQADRLLERLLTYRVFADEAGRMNRSLLDVGGGLLLAPQFTLAADTQQGTRPGFSPAAEPQRAARLFGYLVQRARERWPHTQSGQFGAHMEITLTNDGPVTFWLQTR